MMDVQTTIMLYSAMIVTGVMLVMGLTGGGLIWAVATMPTPQPVRLIFAGHQQKTIQQGFVGQGGLVWLKSDGKWSKVLLSTICPGVAQKDLPAPGDQLLIMAQKGITT